MIIGELINTSRKEIQLLVEAGEKSAIQKVAWEQEAAGAHYLDINCGTFLADEPDRLRWLVDVIQEASPLPLCLDSPNAMALSVALPHIKNGQPLLNSVSAEKARFEAIVPLALQYKAKVIALSMDDRGIPKTAERRVEIAQRLYTDLRQAGMPADDIFIDPLVQPLSVMEQGSTPLLEAVRQLRAENPELRCLVGLSNISFGLPNRSVLNRCFLVQSLTAGVGAFILNPMDKDLMGAYYATTALLGRDKFCVNYLKAHRRGVFEKNG